MSPFVIVNLAAFAGLVIVLFKLGRPDYPLSRRILAGLVAGVGFGFALQIVYAGNKPVIFNCPSCAGALTVDGSDRMVECEFCDSIVLAAKCSTRTYSTSARWPR